MNSLDILIAIVGVGVTLMGTILVFWMSVVALSWLFALVT